MPIAVGLRTFAPMPCVTGVRDDYGALFIEKDGSLSPSARSRLGILTGLPGGEGKARRCRLRCLFTAWLFLDENVAGSPPAFWQGVRDQQKIDLGSVLDGGVLWEPATIERHTQRQFGPMQKAA